MRLLGWVVNIDKACLLLRQEQVHLSIVTDLSESDYTFALSPKRQSKILCKLLLMRKDIRKRNGKVACKVLASFVRGNDLVYINSGE